MNVSREVMPAWVHGTSPAMTLAGSGAPSAFADLRQGKKQTSEPKPSENVGPNVFASPGFEGGWRIKRLKKILRKKAFPKKFYIYIFHRKREGAMYDASTSQESHTFR